MSKYNFYEEYKGPHGPHLSCLTAFSLTRDESKRGGDSIHPRNWPHQRPDNREKQNTCKPRRNQAKQEAAE